MTRHKMRIIDRVKSAASAFFNIDRTISYEQFQLEILGGSGTPSGASVSPLRAMQATTVYGCVRIRGGDISSSPLNLFRREADGGRETLRSENLYNLLHNEPNERMDSRTWRSLGQKHLDLRGNFYNFVPRYTSGPLGGQPQAIIPLDPDRVTVGLDDQGRLVYDVMWDGVERKRFRPDQIFHVMGIPSDDGLTGLSPIMTCKDAVGLSIATEDTHARMNKNGLKATTAIIVPGKLGNDTEKGKLALERMRSDFQNQTTGANSGSATIFANGTDIKTLSLTPQDAQVLETRKFQLEEISGRIFGVPPWMLGMTEKSTTWGSGIEQQMIGYMSRTLMPLAVTWEAAINRQLLTDTQRKSGVYSEFNLTAILRADVKSRYEAYNIGRNGGFLSANDIRVLENMPKLDDGGDVYWRPVNMADASQPIDANESVGAQARLADVWAGDLSAAARASEGNTFTKTNGNGSDDDA